MKYWNLLFDRWTKWELYKENVPMVAVYWFYGHAVRVVGDIYVKTNKINGLKKYKTVVKH